MAIDYSLSALPKGVPGVLVKHRKQAAHETKLAKAYEAVNIREDDICQISGVKLYPTARDETRLRTHHHLTGRNIRPEWVTQSKRIILVSQAVHRLLTANVILVDGTDARTPLGFRWNRNLVAPNKEPMRLPRVK